MLSIRTPAVDCIKEMWHKQKSKGLVFRTVTCQCRRKKVLESVCKDEGGWRVKFVQMHDRLKGRERQSHIRYIAGLWSNFHY